jgi:hypothetical protein
MIDIKHGKSANPILIDFGMVKKYHNSDGSHIAPDVEIDNFEGNLLFSSINHMNFY